MWSRTVAITALLGLLLAALPTASAEVLVDPQDLLPATNELPGAFEPQTDRDVDIVGATWTDTYRVYRQVDAETPGSLDVRVSVYTSVDGAQDWLRFYLWSLNREGFTSEPMGDLGDEALLVRSTGSGPTEAVGVLFRVENVVGWTQWSSVTGAAPDRALAVAHLMETKVARQS